MEAEEKTEGGILLPGNAREKPQMGKVIAVGPGKVQENGEKTPMTIKKKEQVIYAKYTGNDIEMDGEKYIILRESDILGIVQK